MSDSAMRHLLPVARILIAYDLDDSGQQGARKTEALSQRMRRLTVPSGKDITEFWQQGGRLRDWVRFALARVNAEQPPDAIAASPTSGPERWVQDPRADLAEDSALWSQLLALAYALDGQDRAGLFGALHGVRCCGAALVERGDHLRLAPGELDETEYAELREKYLVPHSEALTNLLRKLVETKAA